MGKRNHPMMPISFVAFQEATKSRLSEEQKKALTTNRLYFQEGNCYFGLGFSDDFKACWVSIMVGSGIAGFFQLKREIKKLGCKKMGWVCRIGGPAYSAARYYKAKIVDKGDKYENGDIAFECWLDLNGGRNG